MAQISFSDLENGIIPDASDFNTRFNALKDRFNNGIEGDNIAAASISTAKIVNNAVTADKIDKDDDFVWTGGQNFAGATVTGLPSTTITGEIRIWAGTIATIPSGWLFCDGSAVSQATYANLYAVIGHQYAADPGSGNFRLPDLRNYYLVGANADGAGIASVTSALSTANKTDSSGTTIASKTRRNNNWITPASTQPQDGSGSRVARVEMALNGVAMGQTGGAVTALPDFVAVAYIIKY